MRWKAARPERDVMHDRLLPGDREDAYPGYEATPAAFARASSRSALARCGRSYITPSMPTTPAPGVAANAATIACALAMAARPGMNTSLMVATCPGWIAILPVK